MDLTCKSLVIFWIGLAFVPVCKNDETCNSPQYAEYGKSAIIECLFPEDFFAVFWYDTENITSEDPVLGYTNNHKSGPGFKSGEYDIHLNGSLIITNVSITHDRKFAVILLNSPTDDVVPTTVSVVVTVSPSVKHPEISACEFGERICLVQEEELFKINCSVKDVRPVVNLMWALQTGNVYRDITSEKYTEHHSIVYTSVVTTEMKHFQSGLILSLLVCKADDPPLLLDWNESFLLVETRDLNTTSEVISVVYIRQGSNMDLICGNNAFDYLVWKFQRRSFETSRELFIIITVKPGNKRIFSNDYEFDDSGTLSSSSVDVRQGGRYICMYGRGAGQRQNVYDVVVFVPPGPEYPIIDGCKYGTFCVLRIKEEGNITCIIRGIFPEVHLEYEVIYETTPSAIIFDDHHRENKVRDDTSYDIYLTSRYKAKYGEKITLSCRTSAQDSDMISLTTTVELLIISDVPITPSLTEEPQKSKETATVVVLIIFVILLLSVGLVSIVLHKVYRRRRNTHAAIVTGEENVPMMNTEENRNKRDKRTAFIAQLKQKYRALFEAIRPIPYIREKTYSIADVFVEGGIECWDPEKDSWQNIKSYHNILKDGISAMCVVEADPGCGKSILTLQFVYDWCTENENSTLRDVDIVILLRLRQLKDVVNIYKAIKQYILPKDSIITLEDIEQILSESNVVFVFDGYDEYSHDNMDNSSDVIKILSRDMFQSSGVILTTRTSSLPDYIPPRTIKVRLNGFDDTSRERYIRKVLVDDNDQKVREIEQRLQENPVINDLCQIPLFFVIIAHMIHSQYTQWYELNSVTSIFRYVISCFHAHYKNKGLDVNARGQNSKENDHGVLDKEAYESLFGNNQKGVWKKEDLLEKVGKELYEEYVAIGILLEDEVLRIEKNPDNEMYSYTTEVRFYHQLFCEWYAANYLSKAMSTDLVRIEPFRLQYVYRFGCGKNVIVAEKIMRQCKNEEKYQDFLLLCTVEVSQMTENIKSIIQEVCSKPILFTLESSRLLQRYKVEFLLNASKCNIHIHNVTFYNCIDLSDDVEGSLKLSSGIVLPQNLAIEGMTINEKGEELSHMNARNILNYVCSCNTMTSVRFERCIMPDHVQDIMSLSTLLSKEVDVTWDPQGALPSVPHYQLNLRDGKWQDTADNMEITKEEYERLRKTVLGYIGLLKRL